MPETIKPSIKELAVKRWANLIAAGRISDAERLGTIINRRNLRLEWSKKEKVEPPGVIK